MKLSHKESLKLWCNNNLGKEGLTFIIISIGALLIIFGVILLLKMSVVLCNVAEAAVNEENIPMVLRVTATAYSSEKNQCDSTPYLTANQTRVKNGVIGISRNLEELLPLGTIIYYRDGRSIKKGIVCDRMNKRYKDRIDIWMSNKKIALDYGKKQIDIWIEG